MAVESTATVTGPLLANGATTEFAFTFKSLGTSEVAVIGYDEDGTETDLPDFTVALTENGGTVEFDEAPADGLDIYIYSDPSFLQQIEFENGSRWLAGPVNEANDRAALRALYLKEQTDRAFKVQIGSEAPPIGDLSAMADGDVLAMINGKIAAVPNNLAAVAQNVADAQQAAAAAADDAAATAEDREAVASDKTDVAELRSLADAAADRAEMAADAAAVSGDLYPDEATGRAAVADDAVFRAVGAEDSAAIDVWQRVDSASSTLLRSYPSLKVLLDAMARTSPLLEAVAASHPAFRVMTPHFARAVDVDGVLTPVTLPDEINLREVRRNPLGRLFLDFAGHDAGVYSLFARPAPGAPFRDVTGYTGVRIVPLYATDDSTGAPEGTQIGEVELFFGDGEDFYADDPYADDEFAYAETGIRTEGLQPGAIELANIDSRVAELLPQTGGLNKPFADDLDASGSWVGDNKPLVRAIRDAAVVTKYGSAHRTGFSWIGVDLDAHEIRIDVWDYDLDRRIAQEIHYYEDDLPDTIRLGAGGMNLTTEWWGAYGVLRTDPAALEALGEIGGGEGPFTYERAAIHPDCLHTDASLAWLTRSDVAHEIVTCGPSLRHYTTLRRAVMSTYDYGYAEFTASFASGVMTVSGHSGMALGVGVQLQALGLDTSPDGLTMIASLGTGTGGNGTYVLTDSVTLSSRAVVAFWDAVCSRAHAGHRICIEWDPGDQGATDLIIPDFVSCKGSGPGSRLVKENDNHAAMIQRSRNSRFTDCEVYNDTGDGGSWLGEYFDHADPVGLAGWGGLEQEATVRFGIERVHVIGGPNHNAPLLGWGLDPGTHGLLRHVTYDRESDTTAAFCGIHNRPTNVSYDAERSIPTRPILIEAEGVSGSGAGPTFQLISKVIEATPTSTLALLGCPDATVTYSEDPGVDRQWRVLGA